MWPLDRHINFLIFFTTLICCGDCLNAQQVGHIFYNLTTANGLSSNRTTSVIQDKQGFYWIGTLDGLNRFDGTSCKVFQNIERDTTSLSDNNCISLLEDDNGDIWIATLMGLNRYRKDGKFDRFFFYNPTENFDRVNWIWGMTKDSSGNIWISTCGLWQYNIYTKKWKQWLHDSRDPASIPGGIASSPLFDKKMNYLWLSGSDGFIVFDIERSKFYHKKNNPKNIVLLEQVNYGTPLLLDHDNNIWYFTEGKSKPLKYSIERNKISEAAVTVSTGVFSLNEDNRKRIWIHFWHGPSYIYDPSNNSVDSVFLDPYHSQSAISNHAKNLFIDRSGNYWISTWKGVSIFNPHLQAVKYYSLVDIPNNPLGDAFGISAIVEQNDSVLWLGTGAGLYQFNLNQRKLIYKKMPLRNNYSYVRDLFSQNDSILWISGWTEVLCYNMKNDKVIATFNEIDLPQCTMADQEGNVWVGTWSDGLYKISPGRQIIKHFMPGANAAENIYSDNLVCFGKGQQGNDAWVGYNGGNGFSMINFSTQKFKHYRIKGSRQEHLPTYATNCIKEDEHKNLWLGTFGRGLIRFNPRDESYKMIMQSDGLKGNFINSILVDSNSRLWISTTTGINILDTRNDDIIQTDIDLSFTTNDFVDNGLVRKNGNFLFFAGTRIVEIDPFKYYNSPKNSEILLSSFKIFNKETFFSTDTLNEKILSLTHRQNFFSIDYSLLKPNPNSFTQYAYQLEGFDKDWNYVRERRTAFYTNVTPGEYKFLVKATDENGKWKHFSRPFTIVITTPFWKQWWFFSLLILFAFGGLYAFYRYRLGQIKKIFNLREKISQDLHDEVGATLSSIHVYSSVASMSLDKDVTKAKDALRHINTNARQVMENMNDIVWAINTGQIGEATLEARLKNYGYELLTPMNIQCSYRIDKEADRKIENMEARKNILLIAKEAMNNIAKYSNASSALVSLHVDQKKLYIEITDDGNGFDLERKRNGNGLNNMRQRAEALNGSFDCVTGKSKGTTITCSIPVTSISD